MTHISAGSATLLPCPFCGADQDIDQDIADTGVFWVRCSECCAEGAVADTREEAALRWNTRASLQHATVTSPDAAARAPDPAKYWREMYYDMLKRADAGEFTGVAKPASKSLSDYTDAEIATEHGWRMQRALGDPHVCVGVAMTSTDRACTCDPSERPEPCQKKYAFSECLRASVLAMTRPQGK